MNVQRLLDDPGVLRNHKVLKNGSSLLLRLLDETGDYVICKIAHANNALLEREAARIQTLKARYPLLGSRMPNILGQGVIGGGLYQDKSYFFQEFVRGQTLAKRLQLSTTSPEAARNMLENIVTGLLDTVDEHDFDSSLDGRSGTWLQQYISEAYHRILSLEHIGSLNSLDEIVINGKAKKSLARCIEKIFSSISFERLNNGLSTISVLGHWNYHAENIIIPDPDDPKSFDDFSIIDPDVKLDVADPLFGIARLMYSFPHDTAERDQYYIETDALIPTAKVFNEFNVHFTWPDNVINNYAPLYTGMASDDGFNIELMDSRLQNPVMLTRLDLCFLLCLLRGISINHTSEFWVLDDSLSKFQNRAVLLFLYAVEFANLFVERMADRE